MAAWGESALAVANRAVGQVGEGRTSNMAARTHSGTHRERRTAAHTERRTAAHTERRMAAHTERRTAAHTERDAQQHTQRRTAAHTETHSGTHRDDFIFHSLLQLLVSFSELLCHQREAREHCTAALGIGPAPRDITQADRRTAQAAGTAKRHCSSHPAATHCPPIPPHHSTTPHQPPSLSLP